MRATAAEQLSVFLENRRGIVADICAALTEREIHIRGLTVLDTHDISTLRMVVDNPELAKDVLGPMGKGAAVMSVPVITVKISNKHGAFARVTRKFADAGINIEYVYATVGPEAEHTVGVFRVSDQEAALQIEFDD